MKRIPSLAAGLLATVGLLAVGVAAPVFAEQPSITVQNAWARPSIGSATNSAAYFTVTDSGTPDRLTGASTPIGTAELHESISDSGVMKMRGVSGIALEPGKPVTLKPGSYHVMLTGLKAPLKAGDSFPLTVTFEHAAPITTQVTVETRMITGGMRGMEGMHDQKAH